MDHYPNQLTIITALVIVASIIALVLNLGLVIDLSFEVNVPMLSPEFNPVHNQEFIHILVGIAAVDSNYFRTDWRFLNYHHHQMDSRLLSLFLHHLQRDSILEAVIKVVITTVVASCLAADNSSSLSLFVN